MTAKDKRERIRISISRGADFVVQGRAYRGSIENNSACGVFIKTKGRFSEGQDISMTIESPKFLADKIFTTRSSIEDERKLEPRYV